MNDWRNGSCATVMYRLTMLQLMTDHLPQWSQQAMSPGDLVATWLCANVHTTTDQPNDAFLRGYRWYYVTHIRFPPQISAPGNRHPPTPLDRGKLASKLLLASLVPDFPSLLGVLDKPKGRLGDSVAFNGGRPRFDFCLSSSLFSSFSPSSLFCVKNYKMHEKGDCLMRNSHRFWENDESERWDMV